MTRRQPAPQNPPAGTVPGRGTDAAGSLPPAPAATPGALADPKGTRGTHDRTGGTDHSSAPPVPESAPGYTPSPGAARGKAEPRTPARPRTAAPGLGGPGAAQVSPPAAEGYAGGARRGPAVRSPAAGPAKPPATGVRPDSPPAGQTAGGAPDASSAPPAVQPKNAGAEFRRAWQAARSEAAKARRNQRGRYPARRTGDGYRPGSARRLPPSGGAA